MMARGAGIKRRDATRGRGRARVRGLKPTAPVGVPLRGAGGGMIFADAVGAPVRGAENAGFGRVATDEGSRGFQPTGNGATNGFRRVATVDPMCKER
jgi:hypothetical protein